MAWLGPIILLAVIGIPVVIGMVIYRRFGRQIEDNKRRRQIETAMLTRERDRQIIEDVADQWGYDPKDHWRR